MNDKQLTEHLRHYLWKLAGFAGWQLNLWSVKNGKPCHGGSPLRGFKSAPVKQALAAFEEAAR